MAKKRKVGGVQKIGFYSIKKYSGKNEDAYLKRMYEKNKKLFEQAYADEKKIAEKEKDPKAIERFKAAYPNIKVWMKKVVQNTIRTSVEDVKFNKGMQEAVRLRFMSPVARFKYNIILGLKNFGLYEDFMFYINEELNLDRLNYADGNYIYKNGNGKKVLIDVHNSPYSVEVRVLEEEVGEKNG